MMHSGSSKLWARHAEIPSRGQACLSDDLAAGVSGSAYAAARTVPGCFPGADRRYCRLMAAKVSVSTTPVSLQSVPVRKPIAASLSGAS